MFSLLKNIFTTTDNAGKVVDSVISAGDKMWFTEEEKSEASAQMREWYLKYLETTQPQNLSRRLVAMSVCFVWVFSIVLGVSTLFFNRELSDAVFGALERSVNGPFSLIVGFYFGGAAIQKGIDSLMRGKK